MKYLSTLMKDHDLTKVVEAKAIDFGNKVETELFTSLHMDEDAQFMFSNHILALIKRIEEGVFVAEIDEDMMSEVSAEAIERAREAVGWLFDEAKHPINQSEVFLVATHIEMAMQKMKEDKENE